ncbi:DUF6807 family protein [Lignipirellula cremea]|uniref:Methane oxygenase PmoA n=1 Tax=Lignipirellula cremea TaxID=2528010 RepID=A0A518DN27_9BACT|nr:DUF6807 family protein [Lignipirellula cremea]QDU93232.1 hypothetical protein Pla8534_10110 [Lignipirellula cremea]
MKRFFLDSTLACGFSLLLLGATVASAADHSLQLTVAAGKHDRVNTPVSVPVQLPAGFDSDSSVTLTDANGQELVGQLTAPGLLATRTKAAGWQGELHFVLPKLAAGQTLELKAQISDKPAKGTSFAWTDEPGKHANLTFGDKPVLRYMYERVDNSTPERRGETYKVYHHVFDPQGKQLVTKGPGGKFPHHRGLYYGFNRIAYGDGKKADIWHLHKGESQTHEEFLSQETGPVLGRHLVRIHWNGTEDDLFAVELREMTVYNTPGGMLIEFADRLTSEAGDVRLDGDPQHAGFQFRAAQHVAETSNKETYYLRPDGKDKPGSFRNWPGDKTHANLPWNAMSFVVNGDRYTACYLDRPQNPKESRFSERDYGRFGSYFEFDLTEKQPLELNYRVWLQDGEMTVEEVNALDADFVDPVDVKVSA